MTDGKGFMVKPIFYWQEWHVWEFIESMNLPYCHLYDEGFDRLGCCVCPMITSSSMAKVNQHRKRWPGYYKAFEHVVTWWFWNKAWWNRFAWKRPERFINAWYRGFSGESPFKALKSPDVPDGQGTQLSFLNGKKRRVQYA
jgi:phosphoadenosine phosphosulfate reductase